MGEDVLKDPLLLKLSEKFNTSLYPPSDLSIHLGFTYDHGKNAQVQANIQGNSRYAYQSLLQDFVTEHGRKKESAQKLIETFRQNKKLLYVEFLEKVVNKVKEKASKEIEDSHQEPTLPDGEKDKKLVRTAGLIGFVVAILAIFIFAFWSGSNMCASSPCQNGGTCNNFHDAYYCTCSTGFGGINCETEYITETFTVQECQQLLREYYEVHLFKIPIKPWDPDDFVDLEHYFTTVSLYKEDKNNIADKPLQKITLNGSVNDIFQTKIRRSLPKRIVLFGEAGRGKTTAVAKMAYDWATKKEDSPLKDVKLLFVFKMRNVNKQTGIAEAVIQLLGKKFRKYETNLEEYIDSHEKDIVMIFDGYDEFAGGIQSRGNTGDIIDILRNDRCKHCKVLVTSRPTKRTDFNYIYSKMVIEGYSQQHTTDFIDKFFLSRKTKGIELKNYLKEDIVANDMIATPLFCTMVCYLWNEGYNHGIFTRTKLFDGIMHFLRTHLNAKDEGNEKIGESLVIDTVISVGKVAFKKLNNTEDLNPLLFREDDFSEIHDEKVNISLSLGLLTKSVNTDRDLVIYIEFFHKLAQEYAAGRYLATSLDDGRFRTIRFSEIALDMKEVLQFASGTSDLACLKIVPFVLDSRSHFDITLDLLYHPHILDFVRKLNLCAEQSQSYQIQLMKDGTLQLRQTSGTSDSSCLRNLASILISSDNIEISDRAYSYLPCLLDILGESETCAEQSEIHLTQFLKDGKLQLRQVTASTVVGFERLPGSVKEKITAIDISRTNCSSPALFGRLWNNMRTCINLIHMEMNEHFLTIPTDMKKLYSVKSFTAAINPPVDVFVRIMTYLPNLVELVIYCNEYPEDDSECALTSDVFQGLWNQLNSSHSLLTRLALPIPANITSNLKQLRSVRVFKTDNVRSLRSLAHVLTFLPLIRELIVYEKAFLEMDYIQGFKLITPSYKATAFCELWENLHTSSELNRLILPLPPNIRCNLRPLLTVQVFETKSSSADLPDILRNLPNLLKLILHSDIKLQELFFFDFWRVLRDHHELQHLKMDVPNSIPTSLKEPLQSVKVFQTKIKSKMKVFDKLLSLLPNITELDIFASNHDDYDRKMAENVYYDRVVSVIQDGLVKNNIRFEVLNITFRPLPEASNTVSHDTVHNFVQMLKSSGRVKQLKITSFEYCVFNESDMIEIVTAIRSQTSVALLSLDCNIDSEGELSQYAMQYNQSTEQNPKLNVESRQRRPLKLTLIYRDQETNARQERNFVLPPLDLI